ncbi:PREDICTED: pachytene checkpoint protein 2 homolog [Papilio polytes]|uniref:pachytene checkpoint protein 2 homolog n=1 Tax=Papilio polytes TaxID=76194 RepID=UPI00067613D0|nr:PREDICTED: pachytene checkpoint protein 2 homolog [Papilio polytes]
MMSPPLHVEIVQQRHSNLKKNDLKEMVHTFLANFTNLRPGTTLRSSNLEEEVKLVEHVEAITFCADHDLDVVTSETDLIFHIYKLDSFGAETDTLSENSPGEEVAVADVWTLPTEEFYGLWESLIYDSKLKENLLRFVETSFQFSDRGVDHNIVGWNRVVLLHGPPGTGKTSLCRALAQKVAVRLAHKFSRARLLEINAHGLFSKWFSESGKLVAKLFERIREIIEDRRALTCVLIDEVESLAHARRAALAGLEPSDSIRAVNAILTQLDRLKRHPNVLILTTSNLTGAIDVAFVDRADIKCLVGPPSQRATYEILRGCCEELMTRGLIAPSEQLLPPQVLADGGLTETDGTSASLQLHNIAHEAAALSISARALRRLPFLALALHVKPTYTMSLSKFLEGLREALAQHICDMENFHTQGENCQHCQ